jgi:hypothetical protein
LSQVGQAEKAFATPLRVGRNTLHLVLRHADGSKDAKLGATYVIHVSREAADDTALVTLALDGVPFDTQFHFSRHEYTAQVPNAVESVTVHAQSRSPFASLNGLAAHGALTSNVWPLHVGANVLVIDVGAEDGESHQRYSVLVERQPLRHTIAPADSTSGLKLEHQGSELLAVRRIVVHSVTTNRGVIYYILYIMTSTKPVSEHLLPNTAEPLNILY